MPKSGRKSGPKSEQLGPTCLQRIPEVYVEPTGIALGDHGEGGPAALVALDRDDARGAFEEEGARQAAGTGPDLYNRAFLQRAAGARDGPRQIEIEDEVLPKALFGAEPELADYLAQRGQTVRAGTRLRGSPASRAHAGAAAARAAAIAAASFRLSMKLCAEARPSRAISNAVP